MVSAVATDDPDVADNQLLWYLAPLGIDTQYDGEQEFRALYAMAEVVCDILPSDKPRYLMGVGYPEDLIEAVLACRDNREVRQVGIEWAIEQSRELREAGVPVLHFYSMGKSDNIRAIAEAVF